MINEMCVKKTCCQDYILQQTYPSHFSLTGVEPPRVKSFDHVMYFAVLLDLLIEVLSFTFRRLHHHLRLCRRAITIYFKNELYLTKDVDEETAHTNSEEQKLKTVKGPLPY